MRRKVFAILILAVFFSLQYGKIAGYIYCKWQKEVVQGLPDCGCEDHLVSMFSQENEEHDSDLTKININEKVTEYCPKESISVPEILINSKQTFTAYESQLMENFIVPPFHPPLG